MTEAKLERLMLDGDHIAASRYARSTWDSVYKRWSRHPEGQRREFAKLREQCRRGADE